MCVFLAFRCHVLFWHRSTSIRYTPCSLSLDLMMERVLPPYIVLLCVYVLPLWCFCHCHYVDEEEGGFDQTLRDPPIREESARVVRDHHHRDNKKRRVVLGVCVMYMPCYSIFRVRIRENAWSPFCLPVFFLVCFLGLPSWFFVSPERVVAVDLCGRERRK